MVVAVRGAICVRENSSEAICVSVKKLMKAIVDANEIEEGDIISILFSQTKDLTEANPATALRDIGFSHVPLFCSQEPDYKNSMPKVIRILITHNATEGYRPIPVYLDGAEALRSDIFRP